eukprot:4011040-Prymnesium_polylepis.1
MPRKRRRRPSPAGARARDSSVQHMPRSCSDVSRTNRALHARADASMRTGPMARRTYAGRMDECGTASPWIKGESANAN